MIEEIFAVVSTYMNEKIKLSKGMLIVAAVLSFAVGVLTGICAAKLTSKKKIVAVTSAGESFDADEYVRNLNFDEEN
ncbi:MAG: hypothetical protein ACI4Q6_01400 [Huintestinicola sp.]